MHNRKRAVKLFGCILFFILFYFYVCLRINPRLSYYNNPGLFLLDSEFFKNFLAYPGGLADYISKFFLEFYYFNWPGAIIITLFAFLISFEYGRYLKKIINDPPGILFFVPAVLILIAYNQYSSLSLVGLSLVLLCVDIYITICPKRILTKLLLYLTLSVIVYYIAVYSYWLFSAICATWEIARNRKYLFGCLYLGTEVLIYGISAEYIFYLKGKDFLLFPFPIFYPFDLWVRFSLLAVGVFILLISLFKAKLKPAIFALPLVGIVFFQFWLEPIPNKLLYSFFLLSPILLTLIKKWNRVLTFSLLILFFPAVLVSFNKEEHSFLKINYFSQERMWPDVLKEAKRISPLVYEKHKPLYEIVFKAIYRSGRLPYEQFDYPAHLLFNMPYPRPQGKLIAYYADSAEISDTCFNLGLINHSELMASWALEREDNLVRPIQQQAMVYILKRNNIAAQVLLNRLKKSLLYKKWANNYERFLTDDTLLEKDQYLKEARTNMIKSDDLKDAELLIRIAYKYDYEGVFKRLLSENRNNRMAFEYLMSYYLLMGQTDKIIENIGQLDNFGYVDIPATYQEAILINSFKDGYIDPDLEKKLDNILKTNYRYFDEVYRRYGYNKTAAYNALKKNHGNSYFLYYIMLTKDKKNEALNN